jgi:hypothetical protein
MLSEEKKLNINETELNKSKIMPEHFEQALRNIKPTSKELLDKYTKIAEKFYTRKITNI